MEKSLVLSDIQPYSVSSKSQNQTNLPDLKNVALVRIPHGYYLGIADYARLSGRHRSAILQRCKAGWHRGLFIGNGWIIRLHDDSSKWGKEFS